MGTPVPEDFPNLIDGKWYCVGEDAYHIDGITPGCRGAPFSRQSCCHTGLEIKNHIAGGGQCQPFAFMCEPDSPNPKKIVYVHGPFNTFAECMADCPP